MIGQPSSRIQHWLELSDQVHHLRPARTLLPLSKWVNTRMTTSVSCCFSTLWQLRSIRRQVLTAVFQSLVVALVLSRLDYCKTVLVGLAANLIWRLQSVQNAVARLIFGLCRSEHNGCASQSSLASCSRAHPLQSRRTYLPNCEWQCSSVHVIILHPSCWRAISIESPIIHFLPTDCSILQPC